MTGLLEDILAKLESIETLAQGILNREPISGANVIVSSMDEITDNLGLVRAGEFRSGVGIPDNTAQPFTGIRIGSPGWTYTGTKYSIVGLNDDVLQFGLSNEDGTVYAGQGVIRLNVDGISIVGDGWEKDINTIKFLIAHSFQLSP